MLADVWIACHNFPILLSGVQTFLKLFLPFSSFGHCVCFLGIKSEISVGTFQQILKEEGEISQAGREEGEISQAEREEGEISHAGIMRDKYQRLGNKCPK